MADSYDMKVFVDISVVCWKLEVSYAEREHDTLYCVSVCVRACVCV